MNISGNITIIENEINAPITLAKDAYQLALVTGFVGTLAEWLESLEGAAGDAGPNSVTSATSSDGTADLSVATLAAPGGILVDDGGSNASGISATGLVFADRIFVDNAAEFAGGVYFNPNSTVTLATPLPITSGGTGGNTASTARTALGLGTAQSPTFAGLSLDAGVFAGLIKQASNKLATYEVSLVNFQSQSHFRFGYKGGNGDVPGASTNSIGLFSWTSSSTDADGTVDTCLSRSDAGVVRVGTSTSNALGSLALTNLTASGSITTDGGIAFTGGAASVTRTNLGLGEAQSPTFAGVLTTTAVTAGTNLGLGAFGQLIFSTRSKIRSGADGSIQIGNFANTDFGLLQFGGNTASFPALKRNATAINIRLADDSADAPLTCSNITASGDIEATDSTGGIILKSPDGTRYRVTVANGGALTTTAL